MTTTGLENTSSNCHRMRPKAKLLCSAIALLCLTLTPFSHAATIIDFNHINIANLFVFIPSPYEEDGVRITNTAAVTSLPIIGVNHPWSVGSPYLVSFDDPLNLVFTATEDGRGISIDSINTIEMISPTPRTFTFYGTRFDDTIVSESISTDGVNDILGDNGIPELHTFQALSAEPFKSISVSIGSVEIGIDNIALRLVSPSAAQVPEPATYFLAAIGLAGIIGLRRQRGR